MAVMFVVWRPVRKYFARIETLPLPMKVCESKARIETLPLPMKDCES